jgi:hypothetical protein
MLEILQRYLLKLKDRSDVRKVILKDFFTHPNSSKPGIDKSNSSDLISEKGIMKDSMIIK